MPEVAPKLSHPFFRHTTRAATLHDSAPPRRDRSRRPSSERRSPAHPESAHGRSRTAPEKLMLHRAEFIDRTAHASVMDWIHPAKDTSLLRRQQPPSFFASSSPPSAACRTPSHSRRTDSYFQEKGGFVEVASIAPRRAVQTLGGQRAQLEDPAEGYRGTGAAAGVGAEGHRSKAELHAETRKQVAPGHALAGEVALPAEGSLEGSPALHTAAGFGARRRRVHRTGRVDARR